MFATCEPMQICAYDAYRIDIVLVDKSHQLRCGLVFDFCDHGVCMWLAAFSFIAYEHIQAER